MLNRLIAARDRRRGGVWATVIASRVSEFAVGVKWLRLAGEPSPLKPTSGLGGAISADLDQLGNLAEAKCIAYGLDGQHLERPRNAALEVFFEPLGMSDRVMIVGAGHVAQPICQIASAVGFEVTVIDDRSDFANRERFPQAEHILVGDMAMTLGQLPMDMATYVVLVTRAHAFDEQALRKLAGSEVPYIGMIGSRRRVLIVYRNLIEEGVSAKQLRNVYAPIGLDIGSRTPEEIGLAVVAEMINVKRSGRSLSLRLEQWPVRLAQSGRQADQNR